MALRPRDRISRDGMGGREILSMALEERDRCLQAEREERALLPSVTALIGGLRPRRVMCSAVEAS